MNRRRFIAAATGMLALLAERPAQAHAIVIESTPTKNGTVDGPDLAVVIRYNSRIDAKRSRLQLVGPGNRVRTLELDPAAAPNELRARLSGLTAGTFKLRWQVLAIDGHITRGEIPFRVGGP
jgi:hypothetical protein